MYAILAEGYITVALCTQCGPIMVTIVIAFDVVCHSRLLLSNSSVKRGQQKETLDSMVSRDLPVTMTTVKDCDIDAWKG